MSMISRDVSSRLLIPGLSRALFQILHMIQWELQRFVTARLNTAGLIVLPLSMR
jgi:hypothetical protein